MYFRTFLALLAAPLVVLAQDPNAFIIPDEGIAAQGGEPLTLEWKPSTQGTVTLILRSGSSNDLNEGTVIADSIDNSGSYTWTPSNKLTRGSDYTVEIVSDSDPSVTNYTPYFVLDTDNTVASTTPTVTLGASSTSIESQTGVTTLTDKSTESSAASPTETETETNTSVVTTKTKTTPTGGMSTGMSSSSSGMMTGTMSSTGAGFQGTAAGASSVTPASDNAGARATAMAGMLGVVALGAMAL
ncbi:uncharacterized protein LTR77_001392 [Saxophila tyrrhenica]|uniref:Yeast cell wall synthesis Kre9/Knh1-like N-terminal domain-containing protein n=1 Tax=Saxophila tyrrhenica TaxID=1690608 RepID=A0AAV9PPT1_9PEZI|nr:hypothetical protein LTR77_001392 [Saxophila tyrrhenica]